MECGKRESILVEIDTKRKDEMETIHFMIGLYCKKKHHHANGLCKDCQALMDYAQKRIEVCPFMETKTFCSACSVHCYQKEKRMQIKEVMKFSGPRMLWYHPLMAIRHVIETRKGRKSQ